MTSFNQKHRRPFITRTLVENQNPIVKFYTPRPAAKQLPLRCSIYHYAGGKCRLSRL